MRAAVLSEIGKPLSIENVSVADPGPGEVLVEVVATGLCHTDLHFLQGHLPVDVPAILGHETAGIVRKVGLGVSYLKPGDHVIGCLSAFCGACELCLSGRPSICDGQGALVRQGQEPPRLSLNGLPVTQFMHLSGFAEMMLVHEHALVKVDTSMPLDRAALLACGAMTGYGAVIRTAQVRAGESVAVIGCGAVGINTIQSARLAGAADIIAVDLLPARREMAKRFGATAVIDPKVSDAVDAVRELTGGKGVHSAFEVVGKPELVEQAFLMTRKGGTTVLMGLMALDARIALPFGHFIAERKVMGCDMGSNQFRTDIPRLVRLYLDGRYNLDDLISARIGLDGIGEGFARMERGEGLRTVIEFGRA
ncbi:MAG: Zn-dependent alcohol dehydrogenase [Hyphomicrobiaceae bacterium]